MTAAAAMAEKASQANPAFFLALGDNFYYSGISTDPMDCTNPRFQETFESVYNADSFNKPWFVCPGNHDYKGNITAQIAYTTSGLTTKWKFPDFYYIYNKFLTTCTICTTNFPLKNNKEDYHIHYVL